MVTNNISNFSRFFKSFCEILRFMRNPEKSEKCRGPLEEYKYILEKIVPQTFFQT